MGVDFQTGTAEGYRSRIEALLDALQAVPLQDDQAQAPVLGDLLFAVTGLKVLALADRGAVWVGGLPELWHHVGVALAARAPALARYSAGMELAFWRKRPDDWFDACLRRTALEIVRTDLEPVAGRIVDGHDLDEVDAEVRSMADQVAPLPDDLIPTGLPDDHWWWRIPSGSRDDGVDDWDY